MFKRLFCTMNEVLDDIMKQYPLADEAGKMKLEENLDALKAMSNLCVDEWLLFAEKLENWQVTIAGKDVALEQPHTGWGHNLQQVIEPSDAFIKGLGYYKLYMFNQAAILFEQAVKQQPEFLVAQVYLALSYLLNEQFAEAYDLCMTDSLINMEVCLYST